MSRGALAEDPRMSQPIPKSAGPVTVPVSPRRRHLPATGLPVARENRRGWGLLSFLLHVLIILLLVAPVATHTGFVLEKPQGAGGPGPAGGGGGGNRGTGGIREHVRYIKVAETPPPVVKPVVTPPPVVPPLPTPKPVIPPPQVMKPAEITPELKADVKPAEPAKIEAPSAVVGSGGGTGRDGTAGSGPGSGGGVGSGIGTGRGSGIGPGTGGGTQADYPPSPTELFIPPLPMPDRVRGFHLVAEYDVDETGKVVNFTFTPTRDGGYNRRLEEVLKSFKFRPGTKPDGTPIRMKAQIVYDF
jgi:periplasmic protein TonB